MVYKWCKFNVDNSWNTHKIKVFGFCQPYIFVMYEGWKWYDPNFNISLHKSANPCSKTRMHKHVSASFVNVRGRLDAPGSIQPGRYLQCPAWFRYLRACTTAHRQKGIEMLVNTAYCAMKILPWNVESSIKSNVLIKALRRLVQRQFCNLYIL